MRRNTGERAHNVDVGEAAAGDGVDQRDDDRSGLVDDRSWVPKFHTGERRGSWRHAAHEALRAFQSSAGRQTRSRGARRPVPRSEPRNLTGSPVRYRRRARRRLPGKDRTTGLFLISAVSETTCPSSAVSVKSRALSPARRLAVPPVLSCLRPSIAASDLPEGTMAIPLYARYLGSGDNIPFQVGMCMDRLAAMEAFVLVVDAGSFSAAARLRHDGSNSRLGRVNAPKRKPFVHCRHSRKSRRRSKVRAGQLGFLSKVRSATQKTP